jgi:uncharacterized protein (TIGR03435 family)
MRTLLLGMCLAGTVAIVPPQLSASATQAAQETTPTPVFEVASVKANKSGDTNGMLRRQPGGRVNATNMPLRQLIQFAYSLAPYQLVGGPGWMAGERYDIVAKMEGNPAPVAPGAGPDPAQLALRALLEDRFKLKVRRETREMDIYALVMAKPGGSPGPNLKPATQDCAAAAAAAQRGAPPPLPGSNVPYCGIQGSPGRIKFGGLPVASFGQAFSGQAGRMVVDRTGLTGSWEFELNFAVEARGGPGGPDAPAPDPNAPSFFTAIQEQLGLKLESTKGPVEVLVIDSIEHPVED